MTPDILLVFGILVVVIGVLVTEVIPLTLFIFAILMVVIPIFWPLTRV